MPDRELGEELKARLAAELRSGAPLLAPLASQARYALAALPAMPQRGLRGRMIWVAAMSISLLLVAVLAGPTQPRTWLVQSVGNLTGVGVSSPTPRSEPAESSPTEPSPSPEATSGESPEPSEPAGTHESPEPALSPSGGATAGGDGGSDFAPPER